ncbi:GmrSD restriction endonuclease domain-containing protein [Falsiroseomonas sp. E2-1-a4]|uniref:GmrSD restriction endonuclease domain-containing protein n=1 Tax=Falsiroseomonas sp. E2-1-a4 TaxID=3239299 RepID=UPI003F384D14
MSTITPHYRTVQQLLQSQSFAIDEYQREYKWEKKHVDELLSDLLDKFEKNYRVGDNTKSIANYEEYFLGSIIVSQRNGKNYLIDGQQRVTSLTLLLIYLYREAKQRGLQVTNTIAPLIFSDNLGHPRFNLDIPERLVVIEALFNGTPFSPDGKDQSVRTMYARYADIEQHQLIAELDDALPHFAYWLLTRVGLIEIATSNDNYAYAIFETMNDRGKPLSPVDMLKAYLLAPIDDADQRRIANDRWKKEVLDLLTFGREREADRDATCIKAWLRAQHADTIRDRKAGATDRDWELVGTVFHRWVRDNSARLKVGTQQSNYIWVTQDFPFFASAYKQIIDASESYTPGLEAVFYNAHNEFTWQSTVLLAPLQEDDDQVTARKKIAATATYLDIWLMRRAVNYIRVGYSSTSYAMFLLCRDIRRKPLNDLIEILGDKLAADDATFKGSVQKGRGGIDQLALNQFSRRYIFHLLARVTAYTDVRSGRPDPFADLVNRDRKNPFDIEHIWADDFRLHGGVFANQQEFEQLRDTVPALLLLPADVNRSLQDKPYSYKVQKYATHHLYTASLTPSTYANQPQFANFRSSHALTFKNYTEFTKSEWAERQHLVAQLVELVWSPERLRQ